MRLLIQRVKKASVLVNDEIVGKIDQGMLVFLGIKKDDDASFIPWLSKKLVNLRCFKDDGGKMNKSIHDIQGGILIVSQFTLYASLIDGRRPDFGFAAGGEVAESLYNQFLIKVEQDFGKKIERGKFGADMQISLINDGPVTFILER
jgi:D-tyrosyl-tRNA(Tyr) deacylase